MTAAARENDARKDKSYSGGAHPAASLSHTIGR